LFGSLAEDNLRTNFFQTVPLHSVRTGPYLIARHETTFGDWLVYLADQPAKERSKRAPSIGSGNWGGALALKQTSSGWTLTIELGPQIHRLALGDPLSLPDRNDRREQDWTRLPVVGITAEVAEHYLSWLRATGKVPRARFCTEQEWERAARGADGRDYPQGSYLRPQDANFDETYERKASAMGPDEVGAHPGSTSAFGLDDTSGNVWELTRSSQRDAEFAAKGGGWSQHRVAGQLSNREPITRTFKSVLGCAYVRQFPTETFAMFLVCRPRVILLVCWKIMRLSYGVPFAPLGAPKGYAYEEIAYRGLDRHCAVWMRGNTRPGCTLAA